MIETIHLLLLSVLGLTEKAFNYVFPEYPALGTVILAISFLFFVVYIFKTTCLQALKIAAIVMISSTIIAYALHKIGQLVTAIFH